MTITSVLYKTRLITGFYFLRSKSFLDIGFKNEGFEKFLHDFFLSVGRELTFLKRVKSSSLKVVRLGEVRRLKRKWFLGSRTGSCSAKVFWYCWELRH